MQVVIDVPDKVYEMVMNTGTYGCYRFNSSKAIRDGVPLPKGHGDLVDRDAINSRFYDIWKELESYSNKPTYKHLLDKWSMCMDSASPIIEADTEESENNE